MSELELQKTNGAVTEPEEEGADTEEEFKALYTDAQEGRARFEELAKAAEHSGHPEIAAMYREISGTVIGLIADMVASTADSLLSLEDTVEAPGSDGTSGLLQEDADKYLALFEQYMRLLDGLDKLVPAGSEGDPQREVFKTLRRMTEGLTEFTRSIILDEEDPEDPNEEEETDPEED